MSNTHFLFEPLSRPEGQQDVHTLRCPAIPIVRVAFIGLGTRGMEAVKRFTYLSQVEVVALCDTDKKALEEARQEVVVADKGIPTLWVRKNDWKKVCHLPNVDLVYICTEWEWHTPMAIEAMNGGTHVAVEVPIAMTVKECWELVNTAEKTQRHCFMLENCCYDIFELNTLSMIQQGLFGEVIHGEGAYLHDLRSLNFPEEEGGKKGMYRGYYNAIHTGNPYPTHGLAPICQAMGIHHGDRMKRVVSMSSMQYGITAYAEEHYGVNSKEARQDYQLGDMSTSVILTEKGKTILLQHDISNPRPYSRIHSITGTKGYFQKYPYESISLATDSDNFLELSARETLYQEFTHPLITKVGEKATELCGEKARDYIMDYRLIYCLTHGLSLDISVYDAVAWSCLVELTEFSVKNGNIPIEIPDFTRGLWRNK